MRQFQHDFTKQEPIKSLDKQFSFRQVLQYTTKRKANSYQRTQLLLSVRRKRM